MSGLARTREDAQVFGMTRETHASPGGSQGARKLILGPIDGEQVVVAQSTSVNAASYPVISTRTAKLPYQDFTIDVPEGSTQAEADLLTATLAQIPVASVVDAVSRGTQGERRVWTHCKLLFMKTLWTMTATT